VIGTEHIIVDDHILNARHQALTDQKII